MATYDEDQPIDPVAPKPPAYRGRGQYAGATPNFNTMQHGQAVDGAEGQSWYHTGANSAQYGGNNWIQAATGSYGTPAAPATPPPVNPGESTPGPTSETSTGEPSTQNFVKSSYMTQAQQGTNIDPNDPNIRQQVTPFAAGVERQRRNYLGDMAESSSPSATGAMRGQERMSAERAGQAVGGFEAELVGRELTNRRQEIQTALANLGSMAAGEEGRALQRQLAEMNFAIQKHGIDTGAATSRYGIDTGAATSRYGVDTGAATSRYSIDANGQLTREQMNQQQNQFNNTFGLNLANQEAYWNNESLRNLFA